jgi:hypothetical protein
VNAHEVSELAETRDDDVSHLRDGYGEKWSHVPSDMGRLSWRAEQILCGEPFALPLTATVDEESIDGFRHVVAITRALIERTRRSRVLLAEAFGATVEEWTVGGTVTVAAALDALASASPPDPSWADPRGVAKATAVLETLRADLEASRAAHAAVYAHFTEDVWDVVTGDDLGKARGALGTPARMRLRQTLASVSRTGSVPRQLGGTLEALAAAHQLRAQIQSSAALLRGSFGWLYRGPMTDPDELEASVRGMAMIHESGVALPAGRLAELLEARALGANELTGPAAAIAGAVAGWKAGIAGAGHGDPLAATWTRLSRWCVDADTAIDILAEAELRTRETRLAPRTLFELCNDLLARTRVADIDRRLALNPEPKVVDTDPCVIPSALPALPTAVPTVSPSPVSAP